VGFGEQALPARRELLLITAHIVSMRFSFAFAAKKKRKLTLSGFITHYRGRSAEAPERCGVKSTSRLNPLTASAADMGTSTRRFSRR
jgi:hypothetical protein